MHECKLVKIPILVGARLSRKQCSKTQEEEEDMSRVHHASVVGGLMYAMVCTRPDIAYVVEVLSMYMSKVGKEHWITVTRVFRYLHGTIDHAICYQGRVVPDKVLDIYVFVDVDWVVLIWEKIPGQQEETTQWRVPIRIALIWDSYFTQALAVPLPSTMFSSMCKGIWFLPKRILEMLLVGRLGVLFIYFWNNVFSYSIMQCNLIYESNKSILIYESNKSILI